MMKISFAMLVIINFAMLIKDLLSFHLVNLSIELSITFSI